ncbi:hypothetical protein AX16_002398 [Volvariella volvacea WC 439]|nr:hypothetical protein AX16_002398 [Volvariella volvacea WC 439]
MADVLVQISLFADQADTTPSSGSIRSYVGPQIEDPTKRYLINVWAADASPPPESSASLTHNILFKNAPTDLFEAPVTEICIATLKEPENKANWEDTILAPMFKKQLPNIPDVTHAVWDVVKDDPGVYMLVIGWSSHEAHLALTRSEEAKKGMAYIKTLVDLDQKHAKLTKL